MSNDIDPEALEVARKHIEDFLIEMRDSQMFVLNANGFSIRNKDGSPSEIIRMGTAMGLSMGIEKYLDALAERDPQVEDMPETLAAAIRVIHAHGYRVRVPGNPDPS